MTEKDQAPRRCMLYSETGSQIFVGEDAIEAALEDGWSDEPVPVEQTAEPDNSGANEALEAKLTETEAELEAALEAVDAEKSRADAATEMAEKERKRADAAEKKLAAAKKK